MGPAVSAQYLFCFDTVHLESPRGLGVTWALLSLHNFFMFCYYTLGEPWRTGRDMGPAVSAQIFLCFVIVH